MKKFIFISLLVSNFVCSAYHIVFVHVGPQIPAYIQDSIEQARLFNDEATIWLIANKQAIMNNRVLQEIVAKNKVKTCYCQDLKQSEMHRQFIRKSTLDTTFRQAFWLRTTERFFYLQELSEQQNLKDVFHLENDVMLYADLANLLAAFKSSGDMAAVFDNDTRCIPSFLYFKNAQAASGLTSFISSKARSGKNDMETLSQYRYVGKNVTRLPIIMKEYVQKHPLKNKLGARAKKTSDYYSGIERFNSIFDAAALGQYLGGIDARVGRSTKGFINERCLFNPSHLAFTWKIDGKGRKIPFAVFANKEYKINNLHIHSKNLKPFKSN